MESHIERLVAACGLRHFGYRQFGAPELAIPERVVVAEAPEPPPIEVEAAPLLATAAGTIADAPAIEAGPSLALPPMIASAPRPPITLAMPPEPDAAGGLPTFPDWNTRLAAQQSRAPVSLPPPAPLPLPGATTAAPRRGRPPVVLPPPDVFDSSMAALPPPAGARPPVQRASQPRPAGDRRAPEIEASPPIRLPPVTDGPVTDARPIPRPAAARQSAPRVEQPRPTRRFAMLDEIRPPPHGGGTPDQSSSPHSP